jgi:hypothetical protein
LIESAIQCAADGRLKLEVDARNIKSLREELRESARRQNIITLCAIGMLGGVLWFALGADPAWPGAALLFAGILGLVSLRR